MTSNLVPKEDFYHIFYTKSLIREINEQTLTIGINVVKRKHVARA